MSEMDIRGWGRRIVNVVESLGVADEDYRRRHFH